MTELHITLRNGRIIIADVDDWRWDEVNPPTTPGATTFPVPYRKLTWTSGDASARELVYIDDTSIAAIVAHEVTAT